MAEEFKKNDFLKKIRKKTRKTSIVDLFAISRPLLLYIYGKDMLKNSIILFCSNLNL